jgi:hypothetical protein
MRGVVEDLGGRLRRKGRGHAVRRNLHILEHQIFDAEMCVLVKETHQSFVGPEQQAIDVDDGGKAPWPSLGNLG